MYNVKDISFDATISNDITSWGKIPRISYKKDGYGLVGRYEHRNSYAIEHSDNNIAELFRDMTDYLQEKDCVDFFIAPDFSFIQIRGNLRNEIRLLDMNIISGFIDRMDALGVKYIIPLSVLNDFNPFEEKNTSVKFDAKIYEECFMDRQTIEAIFSHDREQYRKFIDDESKLIILNEFWKIEEKYKDKALICFELEAFHNISLKQIFVWESGKGIGKEILSDIKSLCVDFGVSCNLVVDCTPTDCPEKFSTKRDTLIDLYARYGFCLYNNTHETMALLPDMDLERIQKIHSFIKDYKDNVNHIFINRSIDEIIVSLSDNKILKLDDMTHALEDLGIRYKVINPIPIKTREMA